MCRNNCGFYSNTSSEGLCSICYKDMQKKMQESSNPANRSPLQTSEMASCSISNSPKEMKIPDLPTEGTIGLKSQIGDKPNTPISLNLLGESSKILPNITIDNQETINRSKSSPILELEATEDEKVNCLTPISASPLISPQSSEGKKTKKRCLECKKKVSLLGFTCRCGGLFCSVHRYSDKHECSFDYKSPGAEQIRKSNPTIVAEKVKKI